MIIYLIRHAEYQGVEGGSHADNMQARLTSLGKLQAEALGHFLKKRGLEAIYSSKLLRARETAEIIASECYTPLQLDERLNEFVAMINEKDATRIKEYKYRAEKNHNFTTSDGESINQAVARFKGFWEELVSSGPEGAVIVSHALILRNFLQKNFGLAGPPELKTASISAVEFKKGVPELLFVGRTVWSWPILFEKIKRRLELYL